MSETPANGKVVAYLRVSTDRQDLKNQRHAILEYAHGQKIHVGKWCEVEMSSRRSERARRIGELQEALADGDTLITTELSRLGRSTADVLNLVRGLTERGVRVVALKQNLDIRPGNQDISSKVLVTVFSMLAELERDLISMRTKEALAARKAAGKRLGKPKGTIQTSKFDGDRERIEFWLKDGRSQRYICRRLGYGSPSGLNRYIRTRGIDGHQMVPYPGS